MIMVTKATACCPVTKGGGTEEGQTTEVQAAKSTLKCEVPGGVGVEEMQPLRLLRRNIDCRLEQELALSVAYSKPCAP